MKTLFLVRHAKSSWGQAGLADHERPLNARGELDAPKMAGRLAGRGVKPELILSSTAVRARRTAEVFARALGVDAGTLVLNPGIYASQVAALLAIIHQLDDRLACVMLVGHNPEFTELAQRLCGGISHMPTCAVAEFVFDVDSWGDIGNIGPQDVGFDYPKKA